MAKAQPIPVPAPYAGENTRDGIAVLQPAEARHLENWDTTGNSVKARKGYASYSTGGASSTVETLAAFDGLTTSKMIGVAGGSIYDYSGASASLLSAAGYTDSRFQTVNYNNRLIGVNGTDTPWVYDGATIAATGFTGLTLTQLANVAYVRSRLWFCQTSNADVWYGGVGSITGALTKFQLSQIAGGGTCMAIGSHSQDAGNGPDDYIAFVMSTGEVLIYSGDPATTFSLVGSYRMPPPVGRQCLVKIGGQLAVVTRMGLVPIASAIQGTAFDQLALGNFGKVAPSITSEAGLYGTFEGWAPTFHEGKVIINIPTSDGATSKQRVYNTQVGAWTQWSGIPASTWCVWGNNIYIGAWTTGVVYKLTGTTDAGSAISFKARGAFLTNSQGGQRITAKAIRFDMAVDGSVTGQFGIDTDYIERAITTPAVPIATSYASTAWGAAWGSQWSTSNQYNGQWFGAYGSGRSLGIALNASGLVTTLEYFGAHVLVEPATR